MNDTMAERFRARAAACGDGCAQILGDRRTSYAELDQRASRVGNGLIALGAAPQSRIGCLGKNSDLFFELLLGAWKANVVLVPVNWRLAPREMAAVLADAGVSVLFVGPGFRDAVAAIEAAGHRLEHRISMDGADPDWPDFVAWRDSQSAVDPRVPTSPDDTAIQLYTSGTTGLPKGVELSSRNYLAGLETWSATGVGDLTTRDVVLTCMPLYHVAGTNIGLVALLSGAVNVVMEEVSIPGILDLVPRHRVTYALFVPAVVLGLVQHPDTPRTDFSSFRQLLYGASPIAEATILRARELLPNTGFWQLYGLTETTGCGTFMGPEFHDPALGKLRSCGRPYPGIGLRIVGPTGEDVPRGRIGEIVLRHDCVMKQYWNKPKETRAAFLPGRWFRTGDAATMDEDGFVYIQDRVKDMILSGGENIYPAEVENVLMNHPAIADAAVIGVPDERWGETVKAVIVLRDGRTTSAEEIIVFARQHIASYKLPKSIDFVPALPRNPTGKILRRELREPYWTGRTRRVN